MWLVLKTCMEWFAMLVIFFAFSPLFVLATDWSRSLSMQVFALTTILLIKASQRSDLPRKLPGRLYVPVLFLFLTLGIAPSIPVPAPGFIFEFVHAVQAVAG